MNNVRKHIENLVASVLQETIEKRANQILETAKNETAEQLHGNQKKIDVAKPKGKITAADFEKLRKGKKVETKEESYGDTEMDSVEPYGDFSTKKPKVGKVKNSGYDYEHKIAKEFNEADETVEGNEFSAALAKAREAGKDSFEIDGKTYPVKESKKTIISLTEEEILDLIEKIVKEQTEVTSTNKSLKTSETTNQDNIKAVTKKMKQYLKPGSKTEYEANPKIFPKGNGELAKMDKKAYVPSEAVEEYQDAFSYPGQTNLRYDEIQPNDSQIEKYLDGDSTTGNSQEYGNAVASNTGKKFVKNYKENLYGAEQADASYKRQPQPVDMAGDETSSGNLKSKRGKKSSAQKAQDILTKLESTDDRSQKMIKEDMEKMKHLLGYKKNTQ
jgi:hypothetical protein